MSRKRSGRRRSGSPMELDSFLDIVANLVGIMIILVVVVGLQMGQSLAEAPNSELEALKEGVQNLQKEESQQYTQLLKRKSDYQLLVEDFEKEKALTADLKAERDRALRNLALAKSLLEEKEKELSDSQKVKLATFQKAASNEQIIKQLTYQTRQASLAKQSRKAKPKKEIIKHYPTPIAKTAFGEEVNFQLKGNKVVHAPLESLIQKLRASWETHVADIKVGNSVTETIGPVGDFRLQYSVEAQKQRAQTQSGTVYRRIVRLTRFSLLPVSSDLGVPVPVALAKGSQMDRTLKRYSPKSTTVSVWVYPDSYASFLELRKDLIHRGFKVAVWPLGEGQYINGGPDGFRTSAQ